jgi:hypothetical protein
VPAESRAEGARRFFAVHPGSLFFDAALVAWALGASAWVRDGSASTSHPLVSVLGLILLFFLTPWYLGILYARLSAWDARIKRAVFASLGAALFFCFALMYSRIPHLCAQAGAGEKIEAFSMAVSAVLFAMGCINGYLARERETDRLAASAEPGLGVDQVLSAIILGVLPMFYLFLDNPWQAYLDKRGVFGTLTGIGVSLLIFLGGVITVILSLGLQAGFARLMRPIRRLRFMAPGDEIFFPLALAILFAMASASPSVVGRGWFEDMGGSSRAWALLLFSGLLPFRLFLAAVPPVRPVNLVFAIAALWLLSRGPWV